MARWWSSTEVFGKFRDPEQSTSPPTPILRHSPSSQTFAPNATSSWRASFPFDHLLGHLDTMRNSNNLFFAVRIDGQFSYVHTRAVCKAEPGVGLVDAASAQAEFNFHTIAGTIVGFWTPEYAKSINISGWHLHFLTEDRAGG